MDSSARCVSPPPARSLLAILISLSYSQHPEFFLITTSPLPGDAFRALRFPSHAPRGSRRLSLYLNDSRPNSRENLTPFLTLLIKLVSGGAEGGEAWQGWMRALAVEVMQGSVYLLSLSLIVWRL